MHKRIEEWVRPEIRALSAYHVPPAGDMIKLDAMENPYTWPAELRREWLKLLDGVDVNRYPDPRARALKEILRQAMQIPADAGLILGNGSDELIQILAMTLAGPTRVVLSVEPGFVMYRMISTFCGMQYVGVSLDPDDFSLDSEALLAAIQRHRPALIFVAYPNNPTGNLFAEDALLRVLEAAPGLVVIDEAYAPFTDRSFMPRVGRYDNLLVMRTVSKMGLAGLRMGYLVGPAAWLEQADKTRLPYNINVLTQVSAEFALCHQSVFEHQTRAIRAERQRLYQALQDLPGITPFPSEANFLLLRSRHTPATVLYQALQQKGILIKNLHGTHPLLENCVRVTVGKPEENDAFLDALADLPA